MAEKQDDWPAGGYEVLSTRRAHSDYDSAPGDDDARHEEHKRLLEATLGRTDSFTNSIKQHMDDKRALTFPGDYGDDY
jgi:hypothetical protein